MRRLRQGWGTTPSTFDLLLSRKGYGTLAQSSLTTLSFLAVPLLASMSNVPSARGRSPSVSLTIYPGDLLRFTSDLSSILEQYNDWFRTAKIPSFVWKLPLLSYARESGRCQVHKGFCPGSRQSLPCQGLWENRLSSVSEPLKASDLSKTHLVCSRGTLLLVSGLSSTTLAKQAKDRLDRMGVFRNDQGDDSSHPRPYSDARTWRRAIGEKLNYSATDLRKNLEGCLIAARYDIPFRTSTSNVLSCPSTFKGPGRSLVLMWMGNRSLLSSLPRYVTSP